MKFAAPQVALFLDLETTGLYPREAGAAILEIGIVAVEVPAFREVDAWSVTVKDLDRLTDPLRGANDFVRNMHTESGLLADLSKEIGTPGGPVRLFDAIRLGTEFYNKHASGRRAYLGGAKPDFDRGWLDIHMPSLARKFHYRGFDTNALFILREYLVGVEKSGQGHRVLADCRQAIAAVHEHFDLMRTVFARPAPVAPLDPRVLALLQQARDTLWPAPGGHQALCEDLNVLINELEPK